MSTEHQKYEVTDQVKYRKRSSKIECTDRNYRFQDNADDAHKEVKMYCDSNQSPT